MMALPTCTVHYHLPYLHCELSSTLPALCIIIYVACPPRLPTKNVKVRTIRGGWKWCLTRDNEKNVSIICVVIGTGFQSCEGDWAGVISLPNPYSSDSEQLSHRCV